MTEWTSDEKERLLRDLFGVGPTKPLGYLPLSTIRRCDRSVEDVASCLISRGLYTLENPFGIVGTGALYAAHGPSLLALLERSVGMLQGAGWPTTVPGFVQRVSEQWVDEKESPALYELVGRAFGRVTT